MEDWQFALSGLNQTINGVSATEGTWRKNRKAMKLQAKLNEQAAEKAYDRQLEFYQRQLDDQVRLRDEERLFNDPTSVKKRYQDAGINPTAAFGTAGSYTPTQMADIPSTPNVASGSTSALSAPMAHYVDPMSTYLDAMLKKAQIDNINANTKKQEGDTQDPDVTKRIQLLVEAAKKVENRNTSALAGINEIHEAFAAAKEAQEYSLRQIEYSRIFTMIKNLEKDNDVKDATIKNLTEAANLASEQALTEFYKRNNINASTKLLNEQAITEKYKQSLDAANVKLVEANTKEAEERAKKVDAEITRLGKLNELSDQQIHEMIQARKLAWAKYGFNVLLSVSQEARSWCTFGFGSKGAAPLEDKTAGNNSPTFFGDDGLGAGF